MLIFFGSSSKQLFGRRKNKNIHVTLRKEKSPSWKERLRSRTHPTVPLKFIFLFSPSTTMLYKAERYDMIFRGVSANLGFLCCGVVSGVACRPLTRSSQTSTHHYAVAEAVAEFNLLAAPNADRPSSACTCPSPATSMLVPRPKVRLSIAMAEPDVKCSLVRKCNTSKG